MKEGTWDSIHVVEVIETGDKATYKLTTTVMLGMMVDRGDVGDTNLSGFTLLFFFTISSTMCHLSNHVINHFIDHVIHHLSLSLSFLGSLTRQAESTTAFNNANPHIANIGQMIEQMEIDMRSNLDG